MTDHFVVGESVANRDVGEIVTGEAIYCTDMKLPGMLHGKVFRGTKAHARITGIDTSRAEKVPGVKGIITGRDVPDRKFGEVIHDKHILVKEVVRFIGDPIAAVAAETMDAACEALDLIKVTYEELPAIFDPEKAWDENPEVVVHPELLHYELGPAASSPDQRFTLNADRPNVCKHYKIRHGDINRGFTEADEIIENRFTAPRIQACAMEPHGCIAQFDYDGRLTIWSGRQLLFMSKSHLCGTLGLPPSKVRLISSMHIGGSFGSKSMFTVEPIAALLARKTRKPVKIFLTREEVFRCGGSRIPMVITLRDGFNKDGRIVARKVKAIINAGAYATLGPVLATNLTYALAGTYKIPHMHVDSYAVYTNEPEAISFRGFGSSQPIWAVESQMDMIAERLGISAVDIRRKNVLVEGDENAHGEYMHSVGVKACLNKVADELERSSRPTDLPGGWRVGRGLALGNKYCFPGVMSLGWVKVHEDGTLEVRHSSDNFGQGAPTVMAQIAADVFKMPVDRVRVVWGDTDNVPISSGSISQSTTYAIGKGVLLASADARNQVLAAAAEKLDVPPELLDTQGGIVYLISDHSRCVTIPKLFRRIGPGGYVEEIGEIVGRATWVQPSAPPDPETGQIDPDLAKKGLRRASFYGHAAQGVEVWVHTETGQVRVNRVILACDMGHPINPVLIRRQMEGGLVMSLGSALLEEMALEKGDALNPNFHDYRIPSIDEPPAGENIGLFFEPAPHKDGPFGAKGMGETVMTPGAPAIGNAVYDAVGVRIKDLPITPEKILKALKENQ